MTTAVIHRSRTLMSALVAALLAATPAVAAAPWSTPAPLPGGVSLTAPPALAFSPSGLGFVTTMGSGTTLGTPIVADAPQTATALGAHPLRWAFSGRREIAAALLATTRSPLVLKAGFATPGGRVKHLQTIGRTRKALSFDLDADPHGPAAIAFTLNGHLYVARRIGRTQRFGRPIRVSGEPHALVGPAVRVNARGDVLVAWTASLPGRPHRSPPHTTMARVVRADGRVSPLWRLGPSAGFPPELSVAFSNSRRALVGWYTASGHGAVTRVAYASSGGRFQPTQTLERSAPASGELQLYARIRVAFGSDGRGVAVWTGCCQASRAIHAAVLAGARFGAPQTLSPPGVDAAVDALAAGTQGALVVTWTEGPSTDSSVIAAVLAGGARTWGPAETVSAHAAGSQVAIDPVTGVALAVFYPNPMSTSILYATRDPTG